MVILRKILHTLLFFTLHCLNIFNLFNFIDFQNLFEFIIWEFLFWFFWLFLFLFSNISCQTKLKKEYFSSDNEYFSIWIACWQLSGKISL